jgi:hypothetical protein
VARARVDGPVACQECGAPIAMAATLDVEGRLWVASRFDAFLWVSVDERGRAIFRCGPCMPNAYPVFDGGHDDEAGARDV